MITNKIRPLINEIFSLNMRSPILTYKKVGALLQQYTTSDKQEKIEILKHIAQTYHPDEQTVRAQVSLNRTENLSTKDWIQTCTQIHDCTTPQYMELFHLIGRQPNGVSSLVHLRADLLKYLSDIGNYVQKENNLVYLNLKQKFD